MKNVYCDSSSPLQVVRGLEEEWARLLDQAVSHDGRLGSALGALHVAHSEESPRIVGRYTNERHIANSVRTHKRRREQYMAAACQICPIRLGGGCSGGDEERERVYGQLDPPGKSRNREKTRGVIGNILKNGGLFNNELIVSCLEATRGALELKKEAKYSSISGQERLF